MRQLLFSLFCINDEESCGILDLTDLIDTFEELPLLFLSAFLMLTKQ